MSVSGEFTRLVGGCIDFLEASETDAAWPWARALYAARAISSEDLSEAAARVLALRDQSPSINEIEFSTPPECDEFRKLCDHMMAIADAIVGRPVERES
jgi:hypothetical protein